MTEHSRIARIAASRGAATRAKRSRKRPRHHYFAFLSYSHQDEELAAWLHGELERFRVPAQLVGKITDHGVIPRRLTPIFRDQQELAAAKDLGEVIEQALAGSQFLIVLCSPDAAKSRWTNAEVNAFKRNHPDGCVLAAIAAGEPFASHIEGRETEECFPPALRQRYDRLGRPTGKRAEPLAADLREAHGGRRVGFLKLVAGMLGVGLDELVQRETTRRQRRLAFLAAASLAGMALTSLLAVTAIQARDEARDQRREAEGLVAFMLGDLKDKLEPIGKLDALDGVGTKVLDYYRKQDASDLPDNALLQRARALSLTAQVAFLRGDMDSAVQLYREAIAGTEEAVRRNPEDAERLFESAQNYFYLGEIARQRGQLPAAETHYRQYQRLAKQMVALEPDNIRYRMETLYADANVGIALYSQRRFSEAGKQLLSAMTIISALASADPGNVDYQKSVADAVAWVADAEGAQGHLSEATALRRKHIALLQNGEARHPGDVWYREQIVPAELSLGLLLASTGDLGSAKASMTDAVNRATALVESERENSRWLENAAKVQLGLSRIALANRDREVAEAHLVSARGTIDQLLARRPQIDFWRSLDGAALILAAEIKLGQGDHSGALAAARHALVLARSVQSGDPISSRITRSEALLLIGDALGKSGDRKGAATSYREALHILPPLKALKPAELSVAAQVLKRSGRSDQSREIFAQLRNMGFRISTG